MAGRHRRQRRLVMWRAALRGAADTVVGSTSSTLSRLWRSRRSAQVAALTAEVVALRLTVAEMRDAVVAAEAQARAAEVRVDAAVARAGAADAEAAAIRELLAAPVQGPAAMPPAGPPATLELPLVRLALARSAGRSLTRDMAAALATPDRGPDTARTDIVLSDLPERALLDPATDRDRELVDAAPTAVEPAAAGTTRVA